MLRSLIFSLLIMLSCMSVAQGLQPLNDSQLSAITGRQGIAMDFEYAMNADYQGHPLDVDGKGKCVGAGNHCTLGITVNKHTNMWVMMKDLFGVQRLNDFWIDAGELSDVVTKQSGLKQVVNGTSYALADPASFKDSAGNCLLTGGTTGCLPSGLPALKMQYKPGNVAVTGANAKNGQSLAATDGFGTFESDVEWFLNIGRVNVQFGTDAYNPNFEVTNSTTGSFMTYRISDFRHDVDPSFSPVAHIDYDGRVMMFGF